MTHALKCHHGGYHEWVEELRRVFCRKCGHLQPEEAPDEPAKCARCDEPKPLSTWGKYARIYCDTCAGTMALQRLGRA